MTPQQQTAYTAQGGDAGQIAQAAQENFQRLMSRSSTDADFRRKLLTSPREAVAEFYGRDVSEIPEPFDVVFVENTADATIVLPTAVDPEAELSDSDLQAVAGGILPFIASVLAVAASALWAGKEVKNLGDDNAWFS